MIPQIKEINFGAGTANSYATLHQATVSLQEMGERTIQTQVRIDGDVVPNFDGWAVEFKGEKFVLNVKEPQALKDNTTRNSLIDLTFVSWPVEELKRYFFFNTVTTAAGTIMPDQYKTPVNLNLAGFVTLFNNVLNYYFAGKIVMSLSPSWSYATEPSLFDIDYTHLWDVVTKFYEIYKVRWYIDYNSVNDVYTIKVGYPADDISDHDFEYGYQGGLLKFERQVQDVDIKNILLGRGGEKNLPYRYFKKVDPQNDTFPADPDAIPELANITFDRIRDINFRWYIRGWMQNPNRDTSGDAAWWPGHTFPTYTIDSDDPHYWAYYKGLTDDSFDPVEFVKDDDSIAKYGEHWGALDDNDDVYPTIQGVIRSGLGRVDESVAISEIVTDNIDAMAKAAAIESNIDGTKVVTKYISGHGYAQDTFISQSFTIPSGKTANIDFSGSDPYFAIISESASEAEQANVAINTQYSSWVVVNESSGTEIPFSSGIPAGTYHCKVTLRATNNNGTGKQVTFGYNGVRMVMADVDENAWKPTFDIWVKNLWGSTKSSSETAEQYAERIWRPILGDHLGNEAKVVFSTGFMSISEDYEFVIAAIPVFDQSKTILSSDGNTYQSEWKITLYKSSAEYDATGLYIPNSQATGKPVAGDKFYFIGIDMPHQYVLDAESLLNGADYSPEVNKTAALDDTANIAPTWLITLDKVRVNTLEDQEYEHTLAERLSTGATVRITDPRFTPNEVLTLYVQSMTYTWNEPTKERPYIVPDIEVVLSDKVITRESVVSVMQGDINMVKSTYAKSSDIESVVRRVATPLFLKKTGEADTSESPTEFGSRVSSKAFRQGDVGGQGWGVYDDGHGKSVYEVDKLVVREEMRVNSLVANQITYIGGLRIESAATIECTQVLDTGSGYQCFFDQRKGSVANHFRVGDIAYGHIFDPTDLDLRYYKRKVNAVGDNYIILDAVDVPWTVVIDPDAGTTETRHTVDGSGVPAEGDVIVQFGSITEADRQYVIITDVIGGGYQRMLRDLNHAAAPGLEYYFAGRQASTGDRWFVGNKGANKYAEWENGELTISGRLAVTSQVADGNGSYIGLTAYLNSLQNQIDGNIQSWASGQAPSAQTEPLPKVDDQGQVDPSTANYPASGWTNDTTREKHVGDIYVDDSTGQGYRYTKRSNNGVTEYYWVRITDEELSQALADIAQLQDDVAGLDYLVEATNQGTLINGGLVLTSLIQLGQTVSDTFRVWSGINGIINSQLQNPLKSIAAWYGGEMLEKADWDAMTEQQKAQHTYAKSLFRMDGSGYLAGGNIYWNESGYGGIPGITWSRVDNQDVVTIGANVMLEVTQGTDTTVTDLINAVRTVSDMFEKVTANGITYVHVKNSYGFVGDSFGSFAGLNSGSGGGGGGDFDEAAMWEALDTDYQTQIIALSHLPMSTLDARYATAGNYLPLTGGTMSGMIQSSATASVGLRYYTDTSWQSWARAAVDICAGNDLFRFGAYGDAGNSIYYGFVGMDYDSSYAIRVYANANPQVGSNVIWHAGNDGSGSGLDADLLDGKHASQFALNYGADMPANVIASLGYGKPDTGWGSLGPAITIGLDSYYFNLQSEYDTDTLYYRRYTTGTYGSWKTIAFTDSNVATATALATTRYIWGQAFNGTADVNGTFWLQTNKMSAPNASDSITECGLMNITGGGGDYLSIGQLSDSTIWLQAAYGGTSTAPSSAYTKKLVLNPLGGNVGIGVSSPSYLLDVAGPINSSASIYGTLLICTGTAIDLNYNGNDGTMYSSSRLGMEIETYQNNSGIQFKVYNNGTNIGTPITFDSNGYVGINNTSPSYRLDVSGDSRVTTLRIGAGTSQYLEWDGMNSCWKLNGNLAVTGFVSSGGVSAGSGSDFDEAAMWMKLADDNSSDAQSKLINPSHLAKLNISNGTAESGKYISAISYSNGTFSVTKESIPATGVTSITAGTGLSGGTITSTGTIALDVASAATALGLSNYLPLTGGTLSLATADSFKIYRTNSIESVIKFFGDGNVSYGHLGFMGADNPVYVNSTDTTSYSLMHTGNYSSYALSLSGGAMNNTNLVTNLNADLLDGRHASQFVYCAEVAAAQTTDAWIESIIQDGGANLKSLIYNTAGQEYAYLFGLNSNGNLGAILRFGYGGLFEYRELFGELGPWKTIAFTDSNVATATALATTRYIWGQAFNGTADVNGTFWLQTSKISAPNASDSITECGLMNITGGGGDYLSIGQYSDSTIWLQAAYSGTSTAPSSAYTKKLVLNPLGGNVGIGVSSPSYLLDVNGIANATYVRSTYIYNANYAVGDAYTLTGGVFSGLSLETLSTYPICFRTNGTDRMHITSGGLVGIGTTSPSYALDVTGSINASTYVWANGIIDKGYFFDINYNGTSGAMFDNNYLGLEIETYASKSGIKFKVYDGGSNIGTFLSFNRTSGTSYVGILNDSPSYTLDVYGTINASTAVRAPYVYNSEYVVGAASSQFGVSYPGLLLEAYQASTPIYLRTNGYQRMKIDGDGKVHIGHTQNATDSYIEFDDINNAFHFHGSAYFDGFVSSGGLNQSTGEWDNYTGVMKLQTNVTSYGVQIGNASNRVGVGGAPSSTYKFYVTGTAGGSYSWNSASDARLKTNIERMDYEEAIHIIMALKPSKWIWNDNCTLHGQQSAGLIAQEVQPVMPYAVSGTDYLSLTYSSFVAPVVATLQSHEERIKVLEKEIERLRAN